MPSKRILDGVRILAIHHDPGLNGATLLFQSILEGLVRDHGASISTRFPRDGAIVERARALGPVHVADPPTGPFRHLLARIVRRLRRATGWEPRLRCDVILANSAASLSDVERLHAPPDIPLVVYVHESPYMLRHVCNFPVATRILRRASLILTASAGVRKALDELVQPSARIAVVEGFVPQRPTASDPDDLPPGVRAAIAAGARIIGGVGTMSWYKGTDLFIAAAQRIGQLLPNEPLRFVWIGEEWYPHIRYELEHDVKQAGLEAVVMLPGGMKNPESFFRSLSLFLLPSREDSWPLVMLEAAAAGVPIVCFRNSGGAQQFVATGAGTAVPYLDVEAMARAAARYLSDPTLHARDSQAARELARSVRPEHQIHTIAMELAAILPASSASLRHDDLGRVSEPPC